MMKNFAKLHVQEALYVAYNNAELRNVKYSNDVEIDKDSILNAYDLDNIK